MRRRWRAKARRLGVGVGLGLSKPSLNPLCAVHRPLRGGGFFQCSHRTEARIAPLPAGPAHVLGGLAFSKRNNGGRVGRVERSETRHWMALDAPVGLGTVVTRLAPSAQCTHFVLDYNPNMLIVSPFQIRKGDPCCTKACGVRGPYKSVPFRSARPSDGLALGAGTILLPAVGPRRLADLQGEEARLLALLSATYGKAISPSVLGNVERAAKCWREGDETAAVTHLAHAGLPLPVDPSEEACRLFVTDAFIKTGTSPIEILQALGLDGSYIEAVEKLYNPLQPRVPAGNGILSGRWTKILSFLGELTATQAGQLGLWATRLLGPTAIVAGAIEVFRTILVPSANRIPHRRRHQGPAWRPLLVESRRIRAPHNLPGRGRRRTHLHSSAQSTRVSGLAWTRGRPRPSWRYGCN